MGSQIIIESCIIIKERLTSCRIKNIIGESVILIKATRNSISQIIIESCIIIKERLTSCRIKNIISQIIIESCIIIKERFNSCLIENITIINYSKKNRNKKVKEYKYSYY